VNSFLRFYCIAFFSICFSNTIIAQEVEPDTSLSARSYANAVSRLPRSQKGLFLGAAYSGVPFVVERGHPFFALDFPLRGELVYNGVHYADEEFQYDIVKDELVIDHWAGQKVKLVKENVSWFTIDGHKFIHITQGIGPGFYDVLAEKGDAKLLAKRIKKLKGDPRVSPFYASSTKYFLEKGGVYHRVKNPSQMMSLLHQKKKLNLPRLRKIRDAEMIEVINRYAL